MFIKCIKIVYMTYWRFNNMGKMTTKEILDGYYESIKGEYAGNTRPRIDKPELYAYEEKLGKRFIDMDVDELFGLLIEFGNKRSGEEIEYMIAHSSYDQMSTLFRSIFNWYIDNVEIIKNPFNDKRMRGRMATERLTQGRKAFNWGVVEDIIKKVHEDKSEDYADYIELIILMYYNGFSKAEEIVMLQEKMIDRKNHAVWLPGKTIHLSNRCYMLLEKFHQQDIIATWRRKYDLVSWHKSYFKFIVSRSRENKLGDDIINIDERSKSDMCDMINRALAIAINNKYNVKINYSILYWLGFYDFIVKKYGEEITHKILTSYRDSDDVAMLMSAAREYGVGIDNVTHLKRYLRPFI